MLDSLVVRCFLLLLLLILAHKGTWEVEAEDFDDGEGDIRVKTFFFFLKQIKCKLIGLIKPRHVNR